MDITTVLDAVTNVASGGAVGGLIGVAGSWLKGRTELETIRIKNAHDLAMRDKDIQEMAQEADLKLKQTAEENAGKLAVAQTEAQTARDVADAGALKSSIDNDKATYISAATGWMGNVMKGWVGALSAFLLVMVDVARGMLRPAATMYLLGVESFMAWSLYLLAEKMGAITSLPPDAVMVLLGKVIATISAAFMMAMAWQFGSRPTTRMAS